MKSENSQILHVGFDDTDSTKQGCTTYIAALLIDEIEKFNAKLIDYPSLVRLNPNVPWKTRGNGALCLRIDLNNAEEDQIKKSIIKIVEQNSDFETEGTNPGIAFLKKPNIPKEFTEFTKKAIQSIVTIEEAKKLSKKFCSELFGYNNERGLIGATAAIGETFSKDHTYELITYRIEKNRGSKRKIDEASIFLMDKLIQPNTFNNIDQDKNRVVITPRGPDPILYGVRGESPEAVKKAYKIIRPLEEIERWVIFRTNQGTDAHLTPVENLSKIKPFTSIIARGKVSKPPRIIRLRHVVFTIEDAQSEIDCIAYEPTGSLRKIARELVIGDEVEVSGAVNQSRTFPLSINLEKIKIIKLSKKLSIQNPQCPDCQKRLESMGKNQGYRCKKCKKRFENLEKIEYAVQRSIKPGLYITSTRSQRHLTKPIRRYGLEKKGNEKRQDMIVEWHFTSNK